MIIRLTLAAFALFSAAPQTTEAADRALPRTEILEEDSHPHEVRPGQETRFHTLPAATPSLID
ncbi:MAG TPA: hypothetical protein DC046_07895, partial [Rhodospirillaceae bacterium]|nr:hypothetical protein [Rhodospirillaceae bacterium]